MPPTSPQPFVSAIAGLLPGDGESELGTGSPRREKLATLESLDADPAHWCSAPADREMAALCVAGLWLAHNYLDRSHQISQLAKTASGSYWHGIMHRREGDFSNAKYWFRQVGGHPIFEELAATARRLAPPEGIQATSQIGWDPCGFVDDCQRAIHGDPHSAHFAWCSALAQAEWQLLFEFCYARAIGKQET